MSYRGLILDFAGVLATGIGEAIGQWCVGEGLAPDAWLRALAVDPEGRERYLALEAGRLTQAEWNRHTARALGLAESENLMGRVWAGVRRAEEVIAVARAAREAGMTVAMLSNSFGLDPYDPYEYVGVWELFDVAVISEREGIAKPDPEIYRLTLERMGLSGEECVFVDDQAVNLPPATALGITTVHADGDPGYVGRLAGLLGLELAPETPRVV
ncbi:HAD family hydrolase [Streptomyces sp. NBC_01803]|uniref:HAD family hydrolase n=1 Tax=Streptomyces sp. NBC_01803 TaxID=2975946 RepID=UPI002DDB9E34|nr:HAD family phosphatase [Streptomyces sp. NBC_01803]WSA45120.1 HAD family phosphatase [Streptomyces sp. NBC_01803]